ncbi:hypothetical protein [Amycolatopsis sp. MJM2582]|uniref:hypothetical protein n=1 Tax=Amycolatopsis sp. MJM2582 TaxID=1427749 RepID=UPI0012699D16|nr:hypothetical protein [Amycolatopsis sp. MJM2582]
MTIVCYSLAGISIALLALLSSQTRKVDRVTISTKVARRKDVEMLTYIATFLVPFLTVAADSWRKQVALGIFVALIALFYTQGEMYFWNPILGIFGYRTIEIELVTEEVVTLITKSRYIKPGATVKAVPLASQVYWEIAP